MNVKKDTVETAREEEVWTALSQIADPEIPVLSLVDLHIVRAVHVLGKRVVVEMTPTFLGCPALDYMKDQIREKLLDLGFEEVQVELKLSPAWSTDMLDDDVKEKLRAFGIAPPVRKKENLAATLAQLVECPFCGSSQTHLTSPFGPTLCRQIFFCDQCRQSFERFKPV